MAVVDVGIAVTDLFLLSDRVELSEHSTSEGTPVFQANLFNLDFAAVRVAGDQWLVIKARKLLSLDGPVHLHQDHARIRPPQDPGVF